MSKSAFYLTPLGEGVPPDVERIIVPKGRTTIGRGPFLGCSEKRVSRNHAVLEVTAEGELLITPTHVNPCFYHEKGVLEPLVVLAKDDPHQLEPGDQFSLLPDSVRFEVGMEAGANQQKRIENGDVSEECGVKQPTDAPTATADLKCDLSTTEGKACVNVQQHSPATSETGEPSETKPTIRTLPTWMAEAGGKDSAAENPVSKKKAPKPRQEKVKIEVKKEEVDEADVLSDDDENSRAVSPKPTNGQKTPQHPIKHEMSDDDEAAAESTSKACDEKPVTAGKRKSPAKDDVLPAKKRKSCEFGKKCYRKNPLHFKDCSHPGDEDYTSGAEEDDSESKSQDSDDSRPECVFGIDCYRKNPKHQAEFKHTKRPARKAAQEAKRKTAKQDRDSEDDSFESSFVDDDSNDDSSYSPDDEDLRTLKKEARDFTSNKKMYEMKS